MRFENLADSDARDKHTAAHVEDKLLSGYRIEGGFQGIDGIDIQPAIKSKRYRIVIG
jgi:hypothetical protein